MSLADKKLFLLDMDGTIYLDDMLFEGTLDFLRTVREKGGRYLFLTNNSSKGVDSYVEKLQRLGIDAEKNFVVRVAENNYKFIESHVADMKEKIGNDVSIDVVNDRNLGESDCIIETATGVYNCGIDMVLSNLEKDIRSLCR